MVNMQLLLISPWVRSINAKNLLELALEGLDNKTNVSGMLSSFRLYSSVALPDLPGARPYSRVGCIPTIPCTMSMTDHEISSGKIHVILCTNQTSEM